MSLFFFFNDTATTEIYTLSLHDALPIFPVGPITLLDEVGLDVAEKVAGVMHDAFGERFAPAPAFAGMVKDGRLGRKAGRSEEHTSELQSRLHLVCRLLLEKKK